MYDPTKSFIVFLKFLPFFIFSELPPPVGLERNKAFHATPEHRLGFPEIAGAMFFNFTAEYLHRQNDIFASESNMQEALPLPASGSRLRRHYTYDF